MMNIQWPNGINTAIFLHEYWQKKPLLIPSAFPEFDNPISPDELAGLAMEEDINSRIIKEPQTLSFTAEHGPFDEEDFKALGKTHWSLLVSDVEKHLPEMMDYVKAFDFIPNWLFDDLMISYAPTGGSVGPHTDMYDVFLLQASGVRRWSLDDTQNQYSELIDGQDLKILKHFNPSQSYDLKAGDLLYLPPGMPHYGISQDDTCMTWSFGCRAPAAPDMITSFANYLASQLSQNLLFSAKDMPLQNNTGEINNDSQRELLTMLKDNFTADETLFASWIGRFLTESGSSGWLGNNADNSDSITAMLTQSDAIQRCTQSRFAYIMGDSHCRLFVNGEDYMTSPELAKMLCAEHHYNAQSLLDFTQSPQDCTVLNELYQQDLLYARD